MDRRHLKLFLLIAATVVVFSQVRNHEFVWDDDVNVYENPYLQRPRLSNVTRFWTEPYKRLYVPLPYTVWAALAPFAESPATDGSGVKLTPQLFHVANLIVHALSAAAVFAVLGILVRNDWAAFGGALLFAFHPLQVEPVAWATGLKDVLAGCLSLVAIWQYLAYAAMEAGPPNKVIGKRAKSGPVERARLILEEPIFRYALATLAFALALLAKPTAAVVPGVAWLLERWVLMRPTKQSGLPLIAWIVVATPFVVVNKLAQPDVLIGFIAPLWARPFVAFDAIAFYLYKLVLPIGLGPDYGRSPEFVLGQGWTYLTWIIPCGLGILLWRIRNRWSWLAVSAGIFVVGVLPVSGLIPFAFQNVSTVADRYLYLAMLGPALALAGFLARSSPRLAAATGALILSFLGVVSVLQTRHWRDERSLFSRALGINAKSWLAHNNLGLALDKAGLREESVAHYREALRIKPNYADAHNNLGTALLVQGELERAVDHFRKALQIDPAHPGTHVNLAVALEKQGAFEGAVEEFRRGGDLNLSDASLQKKVGLSLAARGDLEGAKKHLTRAIQIDPADAVARNDLGNVLALRGELKEAVRQFRQALEINPALGEIWFNIGVALTKDGQLDEAARYFDAVLKGRPDFAPAYYFLGEILAARGDLNKAIDHFRKAVQIQPDFAEAQESLGRALALLGRKDEAARHLQEAVRLLKSRREAGPATKNIR